MYLLFRPQVLTLQTRIAIVAVVTSALFLYQNTATAPAADADVISHTYISISEAAALTYGLRACGWGCAAAGVATVYTFNTYGPQAIQTASNYTLTNIKNMLISWGSTFLRP